MFKFGLQIWSARDLYEQDAKKCFEKIRDAGYDGVELFGGIEGRNPEELKSLIKESGLELCGYHTGIQEFETLEKTKLTIEFMKRLENEYVIIPWMPLGDLADWEANIKRFNELYNIVTSEGFRFGFHAHKGEMIDLGNGKCPWEMVAENTPDDFIMQIDMGNALSGGKNPVDLYKKYSSKGETVHYKSYSLEKLALADIGEDDIDWNEIINISKQSGCTWAIVEKDDLDDFKTITKQLQTLKKLV